MRAASGAAQVGSLGRSSRAPLFPNHRTNAPTAFRKGFVRVTKRLPRGIAGVGRFGEAGPTLPRRHATIATASRRPTQGRRMKGSKMKNSFLSLRSALPGARFARVSSAGELAPGPRARLPRLGQLPPAAERRMPGLRVAQSLGFAPARRQSPRGQPRGLHDGFGQAGLRRQAAAALPALGLPRLGMLMSISSVDIRSPRSMATLTWSWST